MAMPCEECRVDGDDAVKRKKRVSTITRDITNPGSPKPARESRHQIEQPQGKKD